MVLLILSQHREGGIRRAYWEEPSRKLEMCFDVVNSGPEETVEKPWIGQRREKQDFQKKKVNA